MAPKIPQKNRSPGSQSPKNRSRDPPSKKKSKLPRKKGNIAPRIFPEKSPRQRPKAKKNRLSLPMFRKNCYVAPNFSRPPPSLIPGFPLFLDMSTIAFGASKDDVVKRVFLVVVQSFKCYRIVIAVCVCHRDFTIIGEARFEAGIRSNRKVFWVFLGAASDFFGFLGAAKRFFFPESGSNRKVFWAKIWPRQRFFKGILGFYRIFGSRRAIFLRFGSSQRVVFSGIWERPRDFLGKIGSNQEVFDFELKAGFP